MMNIVKQIIMRDEEKKEEEYKIGDHQPIDLEKMNEYLLEMNKGITLERE
jgi:hypothetical protein